MFPNSYTQKLFAPENFKCYEVNKELVTQKNFLNGLENARHILHCLEKSLKKTRSYEDQLLRCKSKHSHVHIKTSDSQISQDNSSKPSETANSQSSKSPVNLPESWSAISIVCLQYQYEELSARYESLLRDYDERCKLVNSRDVEISRLRQRMKRNHARLVDANKALLAVGERYMALRKKKFVQKLWYEERIDQLKQRIQDVVTTAERARLEIDDQLLNLIAGEEDTSASLLLEEVLVD
ncbi:uncharacterized protein LOC119828204 [Zerene cesonia]|uniref:uncharacterized protein LOC119828204 n=1 Tax=Zerene cesonia TaxID=33412 RepID=UPI0018E50E6A|nr:uncharacterized protein LOC119828204 [Zerene cesonia]